jgi:predicted TIM-barrel fold metal-dependent hydrolase
MKRRQLLKTTLAGSAAAIWGESVVASAKANTTFDGILDSNISLFRWPFRRLPLDETENLVEKLRFLGVTEAWAGSFEGAFHRDLASANVRLAGECGSYSELVPIGTVDPLEPGWKRDFDACVSNLKMPGIRLFPNLHGYSLDHPMFVRLLSLAAEAGVLVQLVVTLEDVRTQPEEIVSPDVDLGPLPEAMGKAPGAKVQLLNLRPRISQLTTLAEVPGLFFDTARVDGTDGIASLLEKTAPDRVIFGSHSPLLIPEAAQIRVHEAALDPDSLLSILRGNASKLMKF